VVFLVLLITGFREQNFKILEKSGSFFCLAMKGTTKMQYHIKDKDWKVIYQNLRQEKNLHTKNEGILGFSMKLFGIWRGQRVSVAFYPSLLWRLESLTPLGSKGSMGTLARKIAN